MFTSSLRKRQEWASTVPSLRAGSHPWKEATLDACDITFPITSSGTPPATFRVTLLSLTELQTHDGRARVERLWLMSGGKHTAVVLLLCGDNPMETFSRVQTEMLSDSVPPIIPISSTRDLRGCLDALRRECTVTREHSNEARRDALRELVCQCIDGKALSRDQANILTGITSGFRDLTVHVTHPSGPAFIKEYLGDADGERVISFLTSGPSRVSS
ncbi:hypothetical protein NCS56_00058500 [Fusarium sp. Ph1]|nr:hypothetical protein NCS56_00058500 [Fusarium sp. Ph1]